MGLFDVFKKKKVELMPLILSFISRALAKKFTSFLYYLYFKPSFIIFNCFSHKT